MKFNPINSAKQSITRRAGAVKLRYSEFRDLSAKEKTKKVIDVLLDNAMLISIILAIIIIAIIRPRFLSISSIINIFSLTAAKLPIALGIGGAIVLSGTDISAGCGPGPGPKGRRNRWHIPTAGSAVRCPEDPPRDCARR